MVGAAWPRSRGSALSGAILYLAIVAIWAFLLVPRWVHKPHSLFGRVSDEVEIEIDIETDLDVAEDSDDEARPGPAGDDSASRRRGLLSLASHRTEQRTVSGLAPPPRRSRIIQARRRTLLTLVLLAVAAAACTMLRLTSWWVCVPPAGMLGMYLLLLREAARADAEHALWRAEQANLAYAARQSAEVTQEAWVPEPVAEIIDISVRVTDQLYDQYADATVRAVGD